MTKEPDYEEYDAANKALAAYTAAREALAPLDELETLLDAFEGALPAWVAGDADLLDSRGFVARERAQLAHARAVSAMALHQMTGPRGSA